MLASRWRRHGDLARQEEAGLSEVRCGGGRMIGPAPASSPAPAGPGWGRWARARSHEGEAGASYSLPEVSPRREPGSVTRVGWPERAPLRTIRSRRLKINRPP